MGLVRGLALCLLLVGCSWTTPGDLGVIYQVDEEELFIPAESLPTQIGAQAGIAWGKLVWRSSGVTHWAEAPGESEDGQPLSLRQVVEVHPTLSAAARAIVASLEDLSEFQAKYRIENRTLLPLEPVFALADEEYFYCPWGPDDCSIIWYEARAGNVVIRIRVWVPPGGPSFAPHAIRDLASELTEVVGSELVASEG